MTEREYNKLFIKRERIRRNLINTRFGETICLNSEETETIVSWIKSLENRIKLLEADKRKEDAHE